jgi:DNA-nicking Smr family endonuclease
MDFGRILDQWDHSKSPRRRQEDTPSWVDAYPPDEAARKADDIDGGPSAAERRRRLRLMKPQRSLDLHGLRAFEAEERLDEFLSRAVAEGLEKVLVVHGKGKHSDTPGGVLRDLVYDRLRRHPAAGELGVPERELGGTGAVWVAIRRRNSSERSG